MPDRDEFHAFKHRDDSTNGWNDWSKYVLIELQRLDKSLHDLDTASDAMASAAALDKVRETIQSMATEIAILKLKAAMIGAAAGIIVSIVLTYLRTKL